MPGGRVATGRAATGRAATGQAAAGRATAGRAAADFDVFLAFELMRQVLRPPKAKLKAN